MHKIAPAKQCDIQRNPLKIKNLTLSFFPPSLSLSMSMNLFKLKEGKKKHCYHSQWDCLCYVEWKYLTVLSEYLSICKAYTLFHQQHRQKAINWHICIHFISKMINANVASEVTNINYAFWRKKISDMMIDVLWVDNKMFTFIHPFCWDDITTGNLCGQDTDGEGERMKYLWKFLFPLYRIIHLPPFSTFPSVLFLFSYKMGTLWKWCQDAVKSKF